MMDPSKVAPMLVTDCHMVTPESMAVTVICRNEELTLGMVLHALHEIQKGTVAQAKKENPDLNDDQILHCKLWKGPTWAEISKVNTDEMPRA